MSAWINEFHYDNAGADIGEFVEIAAAAGTNLAGWSIVLYNGSGGVAYDTKALSGIVQNQQNGFARSASPIPPTASRTARPTPSRWSTISAKSSSSSATRAALPPSAVLPTA